MEAQRPSGLNIAAEVLEKLSGNLKAQTKCLKALKSSGTGQTKLSGGNPTGALSDLLRAHRLFSEIPAARSLLGITKTDIAACYGNMSRYREALPYAEDAVAIIANTPRLEFTEAMARMTLANSYSVLGKASKGREQYAEARRLLEGIPNSDRFKEALEQNERSLLGSVSGS